MLTFPAEAEAEAGELSVGLGAATPSTLQPPPTQVVLEVVTALETPEAVVVTALVVVLLGVKIEVGSTYSLGCGTKLNEMLDVVEVSALVV